MLVEGTADVVAAVDNEEATEEKGDEFPVPHFSVADMEATANSAAPSSSNKSGQSSQKRMS